MRPPTPPTAVFALCMIFATMAPLWVYANDPVQDIADLIDRRISERLQAEKASPAVRSSDAEFLRRVSLHLSGTIPTVGDVRQFLQDSDRGKRRRVVNDLLSGPAFLNHFTQVWRHALIPEAEADLQLRGLQPPFEAWLREQLAHQTPYDEMVRQLLTAELPSTNQVANGGNGIEQQPSPVGFFQAKQVSAENLAAATSRAFLGVRLECAQCHDHPFDTWKRDDFWSFAAFYAGFVKPQGDANPLGPVREFRERRELTIPSTSRVRPALFLDGTSPTWKPRATSRELLADWITAPENPWFAKMAVNRLWAHFFGIGFVSPLDDFSATNPPSHPELLDELAEVLVGSEFDLTQLMRGILASETYQRSSQQAKSEQSDIRLFARMPVQGLTPEQIDRSFRVALGQPVSLRNPNPFAISSDPQEQQILNLFAAGSEPTVERQSTILQALFLMNGATTNQSPATLQALNAFPGLSAEEQVEVLFLATLSRRPQPEEQAEFARYVESGGSTQSSQQALQDVLWALLNSAEFLFNH